MLGFFLFQRIYCDIFTCMYKECTLAIQKRCNSTQTVASFTVMYMLIKMLFFVCNISHCTIQMYNYSVSLH